MNTPPRFHGNPMFSVPAEVEIRRSTLRSGNGCAGQDVSTLDHTCTETYSDEKLARAFF